jgi:hypothetical protein
MKVRLPFLILYSLAGLTLGIFVGVAGVGGSAVAQAAGNVSGVPLYAQDLPSCGGGAPSARSEGFVNLRFTGTTVYVDVRLKDAQPHGTYEVDFYGVNCTPFMPLGTVTTGSDGVGTGSFDAPTNVAGGFLWVHIGNTGDYAFTPYASP